MKSNTSQRLNEIMKNRGLRQVDVLEKCKPFCKEYGVEIRRSDLSQYVSGKTKPNQHRLSILAMALNVTEPYLMGYNDTQNGDNTDYMLTLYNQLNSADKQEIMEIMELKIKRYNK